MSNLSRTWSRYIVVALLVAPIFALAVSGAGADFSLKDWSRVKSISLPDGFPDGGLVEVTPDAEVFDAAARRLVDLRVIQGKEQEVPYQLLVERSTRERRPFPASVRDVGFVPGEYSSFVADLGQEGLLHNEIEILTGSENFQRDVMVEGSNDPATWAVLQEETKIFDFTLEERDFTSRLTRVRYPESTVRYLRVRIFDDGEKPLDIAGASVFSVTETLAQETGYPATIIQRTEDSEKRRSLIVVDFGSKGLPTNSISIRTPQLNFYREITLEGTGDTPLDTETWSLIQRSGVFYSYDTPKFVRDRLTLSYPETTFRYLRLTVHNEDNPLLPIDGIEVFGVPRKLVFQAQPGTSYRLYYGNPDARPPSYELERILPFLETENLPQGTLGRETNNPAFELEEKEEPFTERFAWLITATVVVAAVVIAFLLFGVVRKARKVLPPPA